MANSDDGDELVFEVVDDESYIAETFNDTDFKQDPQTILTNRLTPKALQRLDEMLDSPDLKVADKAIEKIRMMDKRLQQSVAAPTVNVLNFDPSHLTNVFRGMKEMLDGRRGDAVPAAGGPRKALPTVDDARVGK